MKTNEIVNKLIRGENVAILDSEQFCQVRKELRTIKNNCTIVLKQMEETLKTK